MKTQGNPPRTQSQLLAQPQNKISTSKDNLIPTPTDTDPAAPNFQYLQSNPNTKHLTCKICQNLFTKPLRLHPCAHTFCQQCIDQDYIIMCPTCDQTIQLKQNDLMAANLLSDMRVRCLNDGCPWKGQFEEYDQFHRNDCKLRNGGLLGWLNKVNQALEISENKINKTINKQFKSNANENQQQQYSDMGLNSDQSQQQINYNNTSTVEPVPNSKKQNQNANRNKNNKNSKQKQQITYSDKQILKQIQQICHPRSAFITQQSIIQEHSGRIIPSMNALTNNRTNNNISININNNNNNTTKSANSINQSNLNNKIQIIFKRKQQSINPPALKTQEHKIGSTNGSNGYAESKLNVNAYRNPNLNTSINSNKYINTNNKCSNTHNHPNINTNSINSINSTNMNTPKVFNQNTTTNKDITNRPYKIYQQPNKNTNNINYSNNSNNSNNCTYNNNKNINTITNRNANSNPNINSNITTTNRNINSTGEQKRRNFLVQQPNIERIQQLTSKYLVSHKPMRILSNTTEDLWASSRTQKSNPDIKDINANANNKINKSTNVQNYDRRQKQRESRFYQWSESLSQQ